MIHGWVFAFRYVRYQRRIKKDEFYLPPCNVFGDIWRSFGGIWFSFAGAAYWMVCNSCLRVASPLAKPASTNGAAKTSQSYFHDCAPHKLPLETQWGTWGILWGQTFKSLGKLSNSCIDWHHIWYTSAADFFTWHPALYL